MRVTEYLNMFNFHNNMFPKNKPEQGVGIQLLYWKEEEDINYDAVLYSYRPLMISNSGIHSHLCINHNKILSKFNIHSATW